MTYADLTDFLDDTALKITLRGKDYSIPAPDAETGLRLAAIANIGAKVRAGGKVPEEQLRSLKLDGSDEREFIELVLGPTRDELIADGLDYVALGRVAQYAFAHFAISPETARKGMEAGVFSGEAQAPVENRAQRRARTGQSGRQGSTATKPQPARRPRASSTGRASSSAGHS